MSPGTAHTPSGRLYARVSNLLKLGFYHGHYQLVKPQSSSPIIVCDTEIDMPPAGGYNYVTLFWSIYA